MRKLFLFIKYCWYDFVHPPEDRPYGITCFVGLPGNGKTLSLVNELLKAKKRYPKAKIYTNFGFKGEDGKLDNWQQLIDLNNGTDGVIFGVDEVHTIFGRNDWRNVPDGILLVFSQNRKFAKQFICTAQAFDDVLIDMRRRCNWVIDCYCIRKRWVFNRAFTTVGYSIKDGNRSKSRRSWKSSFIATHEHYAAYDTYAIIDSIKSGSSDQINGAKPVFLTDSKPIPIEEVKFTVSKIR